MSSAYKIILAFCESERLEIGFVKMLKIRGPRSGSPEVTGTTPDETPSKTTLRHLSVKYSQNHLRRGPEMPILEREVMSLACGTESNAFITSKEAVATCLCFSC